MKIVVSDHLHPAGWERLRMAPDVELAGPFDDRPAVLQAAADADALIIRSTTQVDRELLEAAPRLRAVARAGARLDNVDLDFATRRGVMVLHAPDAHLVAVAEHTFALLLALARDLPRAAAALRAGEWPRHGMLGFELSGKTLGVVGFGRLGREVAARARAFGMSVLAYDPLIDLAAAQAQGVEVVDFHELLGRSDVVSLHTALSSATQALLDAAALAEMKPGAVLVNTAGGGLVDEEALLDALESGRLAGAALDTFAQEPPPADHPLLRHPCVLATPHLNQNTVEAQSAVSAQVAADVLDALSGADYRNVVNLPFNEAAPYASVRPYIQLATKLGKLQGQLAEGWIHRVEVEVLGEGMQPLVRPVASVLLAGMLLPVEGRAANWVSAPVLAYEQGIRTAQSKGLVGLADYPTVACNALIACRVYWEGGHRTVAGVLFGNGEARLVQYDGFNVDAYPEGYVLVLDNRDVPGVIGKVGTHLGRAGINIAQWRYGRDHPLGRAISFINLDSRPPNHLLRELEAEPEIQSAHLVRL